MASPVADKGDTVHDADLKATQKAENFLADAQAGNDSETKMGLIAALKLYPKASAWSIAISFAVVMEGFDIILISNFYAYPAFRNRFGVQQPNGTYQIPAPWQAGLGNGSAVGQFIGLLLNGIIAERFGYRRVMICALAYMCCIFFLHFFAKSLPMLLVAQILIGVPWGIFQTLTTSYASEVSPVALRAYLTTWVNACWGIGQLLALAVLRGLLPRQDDWGWRIPYALQWMWPVPLMTIAFFAPESPWWLVRKERYADAKRSLERLTHKKGREDFDADQTIAMMRHTIEAEKEASHLRATAGATYLDCFRGTNLRRTEIVMGCWAVQQLCGSAFMNYSTYFFQQAGLQVSSSFDLSMGQYAINTGGTIIAWFLMGSGIGRRTLYLWGTCFMFCFLLIIGGVSTIPGSKASWASAIMLLCWSIAYQFSVGSVCYSIVSEISARRLLIKSINLGRALYCLLGIVKGTITPYMLNPTAWNWKGKTAFFWAGFNALCIVWIYFRLPEPTGLSYAELDTLFENKTPARKFKKANVDAFSLDRARVEEVRDVLARDEQRATREA